jgi:hypothetical protein
VSRSPDCFERGGARKYFVLAPLGAKGTSPEGPVMNRKWFAAISLAGALHVLPGATAEIPKADSAAVELLGIHYLFTRFGEECIGHMPFTAEASDGARKKMQEIEQLVLQSTPEAERERVKQKADDYATETMATLKRIARPDQDFCITPETALVIMRMSHWSNMLVELVKNPPNPVRP